jgi:DNA-binding beta-propeller fold protein YncE
LLGEGRILACDLYGNVWMEYQRPPFSATYPETQSFRPSKVLTDNAGNVYICIKDITDGAVVFSQEGNFIGYFGASRVMRGLDATINLVMRRLPFISNEMVARRNQPVPVEFSNFTIDEEDQFIYTVTEARGVNVDTVKKLNPAGENIFEQQGFDDFIWGDVITPTVLGQTFSTQIVDISIDKRKDIYILDNRSGTVFQYDQEGHLMFIFGGKGEQKGLFDNPVAIETYDNKVYVLAPTKNSVTVFSLTEFGGLVVEAMGLFSSGLYDESFGPWNEVLRRDANYYMAYVGMGNALLSIGEFEQAMDYFYMHSRGGYGRAFKDFRINYIRENFDVLLAVALSGVAVLIGGTVAVKIVKKKRLKRG